MIISRTPFRISFLGGGTDYPGWYRQHGGAVLASTIDKYCYLSCRYLPPFFEHRNRVVWSKIESCQTLEEITHPSVREVLKYLDITRGVEIHHDGDLPARSGMGSSSAFTVGLLNALYALKGNISSKHQLVKESIYIEQEILQETVGSQDQVSAAYGGFNHISFLPNGEISVRPITISQQRFEEFNSHLMLFYSGIKRTASDVANSYVNGIDSRKRQLRILKDLVEEGLSIINSGQDLTSFGELLHEAWQVKRSLSEKVSNSHIDGLYAQARAAGAIGGKLTGAGGGGFLLLFVPPDKQKEVKANLNHLIHVPFKLEFSGSQIIFFDREVDYSVEATNRQNDSVAVFQELETLENGAKTLENASL
ncbi:MAG TPA: kinase [Cyanobacteria bacterium UBA11691]|nr:kinase [Cyanobacteria bacterium UBA11691]